MHDLSRLLQRLVAGEVEFVLVGGYAAVAHGASIMTRDVDVCIRLSQGNLLRLQEVLADIHPRNRMDPRRTPLELNEETCGRVKNLYLETDLGVLDCLGEVAGLGEFEVVYGRSILIDSSAGRFPVLSLAGLIEAKEAMGRPHDRLTVTQLKAIQERMDSDQL